MSHAFTFYVGQRELPIINSRQVGEQARGGRTLSIDMQPIPREGEGRRMKK